MYESKFKQKLCFFCARTNAQIYIILEQKYKYIQFFAIKMRKISLVLKINLNNLILGEKHTAKLSLHFNDWEIVSIIIINSETKWLRKQYTTFI